MKTYYVQLAIKYCQNILAPIPIYNLPIQIFLWREMHSLYHSKFMKYIKQEAHEPLHSPEKFAKLWLYHNIDKERKKDYLVFENWMFFHCKKLNSLFPRTICASLLEIGHLVLGKKIFKFWQCIFATSLLSSLGSGWDPSFVPTWIPCTQEYSV